MVKVSKIFISLFLVFSLNAVGFSEQSDPVDPDPSQDGSCCDSEEGCCEEAGPCQGTTCCPGDPSGTPCDGACDGDTSGEPCEGDVCDDGCTADESGACDSSDGV